MSALKGLIRVAAGSVLGWRSVMGTAAKDAVRQQMQSGDHRN